MVSNWMKFRMVVFAAVIVCVLFAALPASAQYVTLENDYVGVGIGQYAWYWKLSGWELTHYLLDKTTVPMGGRFAIWTTGGDPTVLDDDNSQVVYSEIANYAMGDKWGAWQVMVDEWSDEGVHTWVTFERGGTSGMWGDDEDGYIELDPYIPTNEKVIRGVWYPKNEDDDIIPLRCQLEVRLMHDTVQFKWIIKNEDIIEHLVGLRAYADLMASGEDSGTVDMRNVISVPGYPLIEKRTVLSGNDIPNAIEFANSQTNPVMCVRTTFRGQGATTPDKVGLDEWHSKYAGGAGYPVNGVTLDTWSYGYGDPTRVADWFNWWGYEPIPNHPIYDVAYGAFWKPRRLSAGRSMTIVHYLGLGSATSDFTKPNTTRPQYVATVQGPRALQYYEDVGVGTLYPQPFTIYAYLEDLENYMDLDSPSFTLTLPQGLALDASEGGKYTKTLTSIGAGTDGSVSWLVEPIGHPTGILSYSVSFSAAPVGGTSVTREINIPATEVQPLKKGWQMISVPFDLTNTDPQTALGLPDVGYVIWRYDSYLNRYAQVYDLKPGEGYWLKLDDMAQDTDMSGAGAEPIQWADTNGYQIPLQKGWNLIGNPYIYTVTVGELRFYHRDYGTIDYDEAVAHGLISRTVFWWDTTFKRYNWSSLRSTQFKPWQGYFLRVLRPDVTLIVSPVSQLGAAVGGVPEGGSPMPDGISPKAGMNPPGGVGLIKLK